MLRHLVPVALVVINLRGALAWGAMGHETVAYIATNFVADATASYFQDLLGDSSGDYLASVAPWADSYRATTAGKFSAPFHFIDAQDSPPSSCSVDLDRDCANGQCVVGAIANYTSRILDSSLSKSQREIAAKMVIHFVGDIGQPLHCEALDVGGNDIDITYNGDSANLHHIWDTEIPVSISGGNTLSAASSWAQTLSTSIQSGAYKSKAAGWVSGLDVTNAQNTALQWATESNADVCSTVLAKGLSWVENNDLAGAYTTTATPVVNLQIAKQGYRLAKWLDAIAAASN